MPSGRRDATTRWGAAILVLTLGLIATASAIVITLTSQEAESRNAAERTGSRIVAELESGIQPARSISDALNAYVEGQVGNLLTVRTKDFMQRILAGSTIVRSVSIAPDNVIRYIEPVRGNEAAIGLDFAAIPEQWEPIEQIIASGEPALLGPFPLVQGGLGLAYREPVELPLSGYWGLVSTVIDAEAYLSTAIPADGLVGPDVRAVALRSVSDGVPGEAFWGDPAVFSREPLVFAASPLDATWEVGVQPAAMNPGPPTVIAIVGALISVILAAMTWLVIRARQTRQEVVRRVNQLAAQTPGMLFQLRVHPDGSSGVAYASDRMEAIFGVAPSDVADDAALLWDRVDPDDVDRVMADLRTTIEDGRPWHDQLRMVTADGSYRCFTVDAAAEHVSTGETLLHGYLADVTAEVEASEQLRISASVFESTRDGIIIMDATGAISDVNPGFTTLTGYRSDDVRGGTLEVLGSGLTPQDVYDDVRSSLEREGFWRGELINRDRDGHVSAQAVTISSVLNQQGELSHFVAVISALSSLRDDLVTGLPGRQVADDRLTLAVDRARSLSGRVALLTIGLDRFRDVNEALGHRSGDVVLKEAALRLREIVGPTQTLARLSGDEFAAVLVDDTSPEYIVGIATRIGDALSGAFRLGARDIRLTTSIGIAVFPDDADSAASLFTASNQALRAAKEAGRDRYSYFTPTMQAQARERTQLTHDLHEAIRNSELRLVLQPVVDLSTERIVKAEALVRWEHPELGEISPARFIPLAEASGQVKAVSDWVLMSVLDALPGLRAIAPDFCVSVNLSPAEIVDPGSLHTQRIRLLDERGIPADALVVEITEGVLVRSNDLARRNLQTYRDAGIPFAIDDFGTGYSSLSYLQSLDVDFLKIDQSFVASLAPGSGSQALCVAIVDMAHALDLRVIAEGVESAAQRDLLAAMGCDLAQGFLFSRPVDAGDLEELLRQQQERARPTAGRRDGPR